MSEHVATIGWKRNQSKFIDQRYSREHTWQFDGGIEVAASASPLVVPAPDSNPACIDPEEAFVAALASCHMLWFLAIAARQKIVVESYTDSAIGLMDKNTDGKLAMTQVRLRPQIIFGGNTTPTNWQIEDMHEEAHQSCFLASSVKTEIIVDLTFCT
jgi:organic hydroperoxide reductase OsmC/OhrA